MSNKKTILQRLLAKGNDIYHLAPKCTRWFFWPLRFIYKIHKMIRLDLWIIKGKEISSGQDLIIMYAGQTIDKNYFTDLAFGDFCEQNYSGRKWLWSIFKSAKHNRQNCSIAIVDVPHSLLSLSKILCCFYVPSWISGEINIPSDKSLIFNNKNASLRSDMRKIIKSKLNFEVKNELRYLENFYYNMYVPYIKKAHGNKAIIIDYKDFKKEFGKLGAYQELLLITKDNDYIAGVLINQKNNWAKLSVLGIKDSNLNYIKDGAVGAIYNFSIQYLEEKGFKRISLGGSKPFLRDGILQYKKKWSQKISQHTKSGFFIKMLKETEGARKFLLNNPFVYEDTSGFNGAVFIENNIPLCTNDFEKFYKSYYHRGMSKLIIYQFGSLKSNAEYSIPTALSGKIEIRPISEIFGANS